MSRKGTEKFWLYVYWRRHGNRSFCPWPCDVRLTRGKLAGWTAFAHIENGAKDVATRHPRVVRAAIEGKRLLNWQIQQWAEGVADASVPLIELQEGLPELPDWVWKAVRNQAFKGPMRLFSWFS